MSMCACTRRTVLASAAFACLAPGVATGEHAAFIAAAFKAKDEAVRSGDQSYGAVVVQDGRIVGYGPSRVVQATDAGPPRPSFGPSR
jgi:hypothetical protein